jgi:hypothetical protein
VSVLLIARPGLIVPVAVSDVSAEVRGGKVELRWASFTDVGTRFQVLRSGTPTGEFRQVGADLLATSGKQAFSFADPDVQAGGVYFYRIGYSVGGAWNYAGPVRVDIPAAVFALRAAQPNPAHGATRLEYELARAGVVDLSIYNLSGQRVRTLLSGQAAAGSGSAAWDGRGEEGRQLAGGIYFVRLEAGGAVRMQKVAILR